MIGHYSLRSNTKLWKDQLIMMTSATGKSRSESRLILIEGIPGSGKTTTARFVSDWLEQHGYHPALFLEGDWNHPADYESVACLSDHEYADIQIQFPDHVGFLAQHISKENGEWLFKYRQVQHEYKEQMPVGLCEALARFDIYVLPAEKHCQLLLRRWQQFTEQAATEESVYVFECCFLQNPLTTLLAQHNLPDKAVRQHIWALTETVTKLQPKVVYLAQTDVRAMLENIRRERSQEWADFVIWYLTEQEYGRTHGLAGFDGVIDFYTMRQAYELELLNALPISSVALSDATDWDKRYNHLKAFLIA